MHTFYHITLTKILTYCCSKPGSNSIQNTSSTQQDLLFHYIHSAALACEKSTVYSTKNKQSSAFKCWSVFLISVGVEKIYLDSFSRFQANILMSAFAQAMHEATFSNTNKRNLVEGTVNATLSYVAQAFWSKNRPDPRLDCDGKICFILQEQFRGYHNQDGTRRKQKALPLMVLRKMLHLSTSEREFAVPWLVIGALFFAMRSCKYLKTMAVLY